MERIEIVSQTGSELVALETANTHMQQQTLEKIYEDISFPFKWRYGKIVELSGQEKEELNRTRRYHRKMYRKPCALCGTEGIIEFRKKSNNNYSLICRDCAEEYVRSANTK